MSIYYYLLAIGLCVGWAAGPAREKESWIVQKSSSLRINGHTNINKFSCGVAEYGEPDTITFFNEKCRGQVHGVPLCGVLKINIGDFDCRNRVMTGEFKKTLQYRQYPQLKIIFLNLERMPAFGSVQETLKGDVVIELAGIRKQFEMNYTSDKEDAGTVQLTGSRQFCFSDFGLQAPQKMGGLIRVDDVLDVRFVLCLQRIN